MNRRQALARLLGGSIALAAADIWIPGEKTIFLPSRQIWTQETLVGQMRWRPGRYMLSDRVDYRGRMPSFVDMPDTFITEWGSI